MIGTQLHGRYRVLERLGEGATGEVYLVEHLHLGRREAIKILQPWVASETDGINRFRREARATNRVQHPNIVSVYDFGRLADGRFFLAMEHVDGDSLDDVLHRVGRMPVPRALHVLAQLAEAVNHAHLHGVIHRDLKPSNLMLLARRGKTDFLKVLDFGFAKIIAPDGVDALATTRDGTLQGTPEYMAPEQFSGVGTEPRSDIYAIGCIAYELVVGAPPFTGRPMAVFEAHMQQIPLPPSRARPEAAIPPELDLVILRCLDKKPERRPQTGADLLDDLKRVPGFGRDKPDSGRSSRRGAPRPTMPVLPPTDDFDEPTDTHNDAMKAFDAAAEWAEPVPTEEIRVDYQSVLCETAETLLDYGCNDIQIMLAIANYKQLVSELQECDGELDALVRKREQIDQQAREREAALRFAIAELQFEREQMLADTRITMDVTINDQIATLERRMERQIQGRKERLAAIEERELGLAAQRARREENLGALCDGLHVLVGRALQGGLSADPALAALADRLDEAHARFLASTGQDYRRR